jgi:hypothetical protein
LESREERYVVAVRCDFSVSLGRSTTHSVGRADRLLQAQPRAQWVSTHWREGSQGVWRANCLALRCYRVDGDGPRHLGWLIGQRPGRGQSGEWKYFWSNFPAHTPLASIIEYAHRRHWIEQYHEEAKGELGWDQYQGRRWDGFHRHAVTVMLSYSFLVWLEWQQRQAQLRRGPPRGAFSPRPDRRRLPLPEVHRYIIEWLRFEAIQELILQEASISIARGYFDKVVFKEIFSQP